MTPDVFEYWTAQASGVSTIPDGNDLNSDTAYTGHYYTIAFDIVAPEGQGRWEPWRHWNETNVGWLNEKGVLKYQQWRMTSCAGHDRNLPYSDSVAPLDLSSSSSHSGCSKCTCLILKNTWGAMGLVFPAHHRTLI